MVMGKTPMEIALEKLPTPFYLLNTDEFSRRFAQTAAWAGGDFHLCYAMKSNPFLVKEAAAMAERVEVCSFGEYKICMAAGVAPEKLLISGVVKKKEELDEILNTCGERCCYTAESPSQFRQLAEFAAGHPEQRIRVFPRLTSGNQFGMDEENILELLRGSRPANLIPAGIHFFSGTRKRKPEQLEREFSHLDAFLERAEQAAGQKIPELEYGPGITCAYFEEERQLREEDFFDALKRAANAMRWKGAVTLEMGRCFSGTCGEYAVRVVDTKQSEGTSWCLVDGGMHQLQYDGQMRGMMHPFLYRIAADSATGTAADSECYTNDGKSADRTGSGKAAAVPEPEISGKKEDNRLWTVCGSLCTTNDIICSRVILGNVQPGDILVFENTGAYSMMEGMALFLSHELPAIAAWSEKDGLKILRERTETWPMNL